MKSSLRPYWDLFGEYVRPQRRPFALLSILLLSKIGLQLVNPQFMRTFIDLATGVADATETGGGMDPLVRAGLFFLIAAILQQVATVGVVYVGRDLGWKTTNALRADLAAHCLQLDMSFHNARTPGEMIERVDGDVNELSNFFSQFVISVFGNSLLLVGVLALLFQADWRAGLVMTLFSALTMAVVGKLQGYGSVLWKERRQAVADLFGYIEERLAGTEDIRSSGATAYVMRGFFQLLRTAHRTLVRAGTLGAGISVNTTNALFAVASAAALAIGASLYLSGTITVGTVYLILHYTNTLRWPITEVARQVQHLQQAGASIKRVQELLSIESKTAQGATTAPLQSTSGALAVAFENVSFGYDPEETKAEGSPSGKRPTDGSLPDGGPPADNAPTKEMVLRDLSFTLVPGTVLGLLGRTGSGKTTLCRLLFRLYDPDQGAIRFAGDGLAVGGPTSPGQNGDGADDRTTWVDIRTLPLSDLRGRVGIVTQDIQLFQASVRDNLTLFDPSISDERIQAAIETLGMGGWLSSLPEGLDTELASGGKGLSAGEAQLLALTRIFMQDPALVVLDEASSRLDPATEAVLEHAIDALLRDRTAIVIAHRLHTVQRADEILILENGAICERGARTDLARDPTTRFHSLLQTGMEEVLA